jgi:hypothetical protein
MGLYQSEPAAQIAGESATLPLARGFLNDLAAAQGGTEGRTGQCWLRS